MDFLDPAGRSSYRYDMNEQIKRRLIDAFDFAEQVNFIDGLQLKTIEVRSGIDRILAQAAGVQWFRRPYCFWRAGERERPMGNDFLSLSCSRVRAKFRVSHFCHEDNESEGGSNNSGFMRH